MEADGPGTAGLEEQSGDRGRPKPTSFTAVNRCYPIGSKGKLQQRER